MHRRTVSIVGAIIVVGGLICTPMVLGEWPTRPEPAADGWGNSPASSTKAELDSVVMKGSPDGLLANRRPAGGGDVQFFDDEVAFIRFVEKQGKMLGGIEDFEEGVIPPGQFAMLDDPLQGNVPNVDPATGWGFPSGLEQQIIIQSNLGPNPNAPNPNPRGLTGLVFVGANAPIPITKAVASNHGVDSLDLIFSLPSLFTEPNHTGIGMTFGSATFNPPQSTTMHFTVFDKNNEVLGEHLVAVQQMAIYFFGVWSDQPIGRINLYDIMSANNQGLEGVDDIQMWVENPECQSDEECDDGDACTDDFCDPDDPNADENGCVHAAVNCSGAGDQCNTASCDPNGAEGNCDVLTPLPDGMSCDDGDACTENDECIKGFCMGPPIDCDDDNECTWDTCHPTSGCVYDWVMCPEGEVCDPATGVCVEIQDPCECVNGRVTLCHIPPGNLSNARTITVGCAARDKHLAHGDFCGPCE